MAILQCGALTALPPYGVAIHELIVNFVLWICSTSLPFQNEQATTEHVNVHQFFQPQNSLFATYKSTTVSHKTTYPTLFEKLFQSLSLCSWRGFQTQQKSSTLGSRPNDLHSPKTYIFRWPKRRTASERTIFLSVSRTITFSKPTVPYGAQIPTYFSYLPIREMVRQTKAIICLIKIGKQVNVKKGTCFVLTNQRLTPKSPFPFTIRHSALSRS